MLTAPLHVERAKVHRHVEDKLEEAVPQCIHHHVILCVQLSWPGDQAAEQRVDPTCNGATTLVRGSGFHRFSARTTKFHFIHFMSLSASGHCSVSF